MPVFIFLSTRSYERELEPWISCRFQRFLSTRSYEREPPPVKVLMRPHISIHPLLRAGTQGRTLSGRQYISIHPLLRAGTHSVTSSILRPHFYPPALTSGNRGCRYLPPANLFLSTRSYERELYSVFVSIDNPISIHPLLRAGTCGFSDFHIRHISIHPLLRAGTSY